ncbi:glycosyltransferase family 2 protein [uncultured Culturomica sp.]|uniref:glycosyltransferase family 2 protein n=1 Tax=uncultured Culturomica sp. TaxID=1926654 RepID=UPI00033622A9|nr:glycosyltransferase family 2 protein [uncultured Culturomica sp.]CCZ10702.1 glycosyl transferase family 2 [Odoribacter sp. CAG:788]
MARVAVIILNWNGRHLLGEYLPSVIRNTNPALGRVVVADNCSTDDSLALLADGFPDVDVIRFSENYGFAGGYNRAIAQVEEEYVVLLNSDVEVAPGWLEPMIALLDGDSGLAAVQPKVLAWKEKKRFEYAGACGGYIDKWGFPFCRGRILDTTEKDEGQYDDVAEVFWCTGAALCIRRDVYLTCGGLDERFFAHMEEIDLCWRLRNRGYTLKVEPESVVYHLGGGSLPMNHPRKLFLNYRNNLLMMYKNLDAANWRRVIWWRRLLDSAAFALFLLKGQWANARSVWEAYRAFRKLKKEYTEGTGNRKDKCIYKKSIVYAYFIRKMRRFSDLQQGWR